MAKRRLSRQQQWRIDKIQQERSDRAQRRAERAEEAIDEGELGSEQLGLVIAHYGTQIEVEGSQGDWQGQRQRCHVRANIEALVTGDTVVWRPGKPTGVIVANQPRRSLLCRPDAYGVLKPVAANIDLIVIVIAPEPAAHPNLIDRYLIAAENIGIQPVLLLNKTDLITDHNRPALTELLDLYAALGYVVIQASTVRDSGLQELQQCLDGKVSVFVGQSGVGKSSLVNALLPEAAAKVGALSASHGKGTHTTTTAQLFHFPAGGDLIDSPGIREFGLGHISKEELLEGFREFRPWLGHCRFRDCRHEKEPGCALLGAVESNAINILRWQSYQRILQQLGEDHFNNGRK